MGAHIDGGSKKKKEKTGHRSLALASEGCTGRLGDNPVCCIATLTREGVGDGGGSLSRSLHAQYLAEKDTIYPDL